MNELKQKLILRAKKQYKQIYPCSSKKSIRDCFTVENDRMIFWFNTADETTHILMQELA
ncbi:MAG: hypothetical protein JW768_16140 [Chitinispirillaceae bacterium]|nr:hypothetical protein [Chitinispirillaceae bacterium]